MRGLTKVAVVVFAVAVFVLARVPVALAANVTLTSSQPDPYIGEQVTFTASSSSSADTNFNFFVDGVQKTTAPNNSSPVFQYTFTGPPAAHTVMVQALQCSDCPSDGSAQVTETAVNPISGSISASPGQPQVGQQTTLTANVSGGNAPLSYAWDTTGGSSFSNGTGQSIHVTFTTPGAHTVKVRVTDSASPRHVQVITGTVTVGCLETLDFGLAEVTASDCLTPVAGSSPERFDTTGAMKLNGIPFPAPLHGLHYTITLPGAPDPGGEVDLGTTTINLGGFVAFHGSINWKLPAGGKGDEKQVAQLGVPAGTKLKGLSVGGSIALRLGYSSSGVHYATFPMNIDLPDVFKSGPSGQSGGVSATGSLRVDLQGVHYDGLRLEAHNVWVGRLQVQQVCFSFVPGGASQAVEPCPVPSLEGQPYINCSTNSNVDRWDGNAVLILPSASHPHLALFGGVAGGRVSELGGFADNLGTSLPLAEGVYLTRVGVGLCLYPPPFKLRGDVGISALPTGNRSALTVNGSFLYTDPFGNQPWSLRLSGNMSLEGIQVGSGFLTIRPTGSIDFGLDSSFSLFSVVNIHGSASGWLETARRAFNLDGNVRACLRSVCASAEAVLSTVGLAGCLDLGHITYYVLVKNHNWHWYTPWRVHWESRTVYLQAGFGYRWHASNVRLFGGSCDLGSYSASRAADVRVASGAVAVRIPTGTPAEALRITSQGSPPKVVVTGPNGAQLVSPANGGSASVPGRFVLVPNTSDGSTSVLLINPAAGVWTVRPQPGSSISGVQTATFTAPPDVTGAVVAGHHGTRVVSVAYALPAGDSISLVERGAEVDRTIAGAVNGHACPGPRRPGGEQLRCAELSFDPAFGPGGMREILAVITHNGMPAATLPVASFRVGPPAKPSRPLHLQLVRRSGGVVFAWAAVGVARRYTVSIKLSSGRLFGATIGGTCRGVFVRAVPAGVAVSAEVAGVRTDLVTGPFASARLGPGQKRSGSRGALPRAICST